MGILRSVVVDPFETVSGLVDVAFSIVVGRGRDSRHRKENKVTEETMSVKEGLLIFKENLNASDTIANYAN